jgi:plasmid stabilization system protein ParE
MLSPEALQDLEDTWDFIASDSVTAANQLQDEFFEAFEELARRPGMGHTRSDLTKRDVRFWPVGSYLIVYRVAPSQLQVVAVLHGARDIPSVMRKR